MAGWPISRDLPKLTADRTKTIRFKKSKYCVGRFLYTKMVQEQQIALLSKWK